MSLGRAVLPERMNLEDGTSALQPQIWGRGAGLELFIHLPGWCAAARVDSQSSFFCVTPNGGEGVTLISEADRRAEEKRLGKDPFTTLRWLRVSAVD